MASEATQHRPHLRWVAALAIVTATVATVLILRGGSGDGEADPLAGAPLPERLAAEVVVTLEQASQAEHADHGHHFEEEAHGVVCAARTFGFDPPDATTAQEVRVVYAHHMCAEIGPGLGWPQAVRAAGPLAAELTEPMTVRLPETALPGVEGVSYADRVREIIPERLHEPALAPDGFADPEVAEQLRQRFESARG
jgi:hypothetical protein